MWFIVERQFLYEDEGDERPAGTWRQIGEFTGSDPSASYAAASEYVRRELVTYNHPARYRILKVEVVDVIGRPAGFRPGTVNVIAADPGAGKAITPQD